MEFGSESARTYLLLTSLSDTAETISSRPGSITIIISFETSIFPRFSDNCLYKENKERQRDQDRRHTRIDDHKGQIFAGQFVRRCGSFSARNLSYNSDDISSPPFFPLQHGFAVHENLHEWAIAFE